MCAAQPNWAYSDTTATSNWFPSLDQIRRPCVGPNSLPAGMYSIRTSGAWWAFIRDVIHFADVYNSANDIGGGDVTGEPTAAYNSLWIRRLLTAGRPWRAELMEEEPDLRLAQCQMTWRRRWTSGCHSYRPDCHGSVHINKRDQIMKTNNINVSKRTRKNRILADYSYH